MSFHAKPTEFANSEEIHLASASAWTAPNDVEQPFSVDHVRFN